MIMIMTIINVYCENSYKLRFLLRKKKKEIFLLAKSEGWKVNVYCVPSDSKSSKIIIRQKICLKAKLYFQER